MPWYASVLLVLDQSAQDNGRSVRRGNIRANILSVDCWHLIAADVYGSVRDNAVELLQNIERHFLLGINERHDLELKHDLLVLDARLDRGTVGWYPALVRVLIGTGTSWPDAMIAFLLLLVKTVGRERILNLLVDSSRCTMAAKALPAAT